MEFGVHLRDLISNGCSDICVVFFDLAHRLSYTGGAWKVRVGDVPPKRKVKEDQLRDRAKAVDCSGRLVISNRYI